MSRPAFPSGRKALLLLLGLAAAVVGGAWWSQRAPPEPMHNGQRLSEWLSGLKDNHEYVLTFEAVDVFGPGTVPYLTYLAEYGRHPFEGHGPLPFDKAPDWLRRWLPQKWGGLRQSSSIDERISVLWALSLLGPKAAPAIPALVSHLESENEMLRAYAAKALSCLGPVSWPAVHRALEHGSAGARRVILGNIQYRLLKSTPNAELRLVAEALTRGCNDPDADVRRVAALSIAASYSLRPDTALFDPAISELTRLLSDPNAEVRATTASAIGELGAKGASAIPQLIQLLDDPSVQIRSQVAKTLGAVDLAEMRSAARLRAMVRHDAELDCRTKAGEALKKFSRSHEAKWASEVGLLEQ